MNSEAGNISQRSAFRPRARIMKTLGEELISSDTVAVIELVKNAYDANAKAVLIRFVPPLVAGDGCIEVIDNGSGMSLETVRGAWMEPATPSKRKKKVSDGRRALGEKGIGRFAAARLATSLDLFSREPGSSKEVHAFFDWTQFENDETYLDEIFMPITQRPAQEVSKSGVLNLLCELGELKGRYDYSHGTVLRLNRLTQDWARSHFEDLQRGLSRLVSPFATLQDFRIKVSAPPPFAEFSTEINPPDSINYPHYLVEGEVNADGDCNISYSVLAIGRKESFSGKLFKTSAGWIVSEPSANTSADGSAPKCGPIRIHLRIWDRDDLGNIVQKTGATLSSVRHDLDAFAGVNIYRDNFRVMPYGEPNNDWLRLDMRRVQNPTTRLSNNQIVGYVSITADGNPELQDQSNREGLRESEAFSDLQGIILSILAQIETIRKVARVKGSRAVAKDEVRQRGGLFAEVDLSPLRTHLEQAHPSDKAVTALVDEAAHSFARQLEEIKAVVARYQGLATLGKLMDVVLHDGRQPLMKIVSEAVLGQEDVDAVGDGSHPIFSKIRHRFGSIEKQGGALRTVFRRIEPFAGRKRGRPAQLYLEEIINGAFDLMETRVKQLGVIVMLPKTQTLVRVDQAEIQEVIVNLLENSLFWLETVPKGARRIAVDVRRTAEEQVEITFADSGPGVPVAIRDSIFEPYFSSKPNGVGLGLAISGEIVSDFYGGTLQLMDSSRLGGAAFRVILKKRV
ncbi:sensor histidine kinase [Cupriavidus sp. IDO]|uniref:sensor histidine kinase n=1 Tax=Cupriavidus sp. IDO TaxID=1539142 RepID=UPI0009E236D7|nr:ATP-binding protein [Cupriavidus sp. IDO]